MSDKIPHMGTDYTGYVGPDMAPFKCGNCTHFLDKLSGCTHPEVLEDNEIPQHTGDLRYAEVDKDGCCNEFFSRKAKK